MPLGSYQAPPLKRGDRAVCLFRDCELVIPGWTDARIPWPQWHALDSSGPGSGLLADEELARAVRRRDVLVDGLSLEMLRRQAGLAEELRAGVEEDPAASFGSLRVRAHS